MYNGCIKFSARDKKYVLVNMAFLYNLLQYYTNVG